MALWAGEWSAQLGDGHVRDVGGTGLHCPRMDGQGHSHTSTCRHGLFSSENAIVEGTRRMFTARRTYQFMEQREPVFRSPPHAVTLPTGTQQLALIGPTRHIWIRP